MTTYMCPVCGYDGLQEPPYDEKTGDPSFNICPCCGCEYGYDDATDVAKEKFLKKWINGGAVWFNPDLKPPDWNLKSQIKGIGLDIDLLKDTT
jgi:hypothetical protein